MSGADGSYIPGDVIDLEDDHAKRLVASGQAEAVTAKKTTKRTRVTKPKETR